MMNKCKDLHMWKNDKFFSVAKDLTFDSCNPFNLVEEKQINKDSLNTFKRVVFFGGLHCLGCSSL